MLGHYLKAITIPVTIFTISFVVSQTVDVKETPNSDRFTDVLGDSDQGNNVELEQWCYKPKGDDCLWYTECLAKYFKSERSKESYALGFAVPICTAFTNSRNNFSPIGQKWVDTTRSCLQTKLIPLLSKDPSLTDQQVQDFAYNTHVECYTDPASGDPGFCSLSLTDMSRIAWITKGAFAKQFSNSVRLVFSILKGCASFV